MKKLLVMVVLCSILLSCGDEKSSSDYKKGYNDGYNGETPRKNSTAYTDGYEEGKFDGDCDYYQQNKELHHYLWDKYLKCD